ncbi:antibiotic biosynthesis monooxygenase [Streptomyces lydicus]|uniref:antibiotic biosynthesis monooxygenase n=1 Tax=Streptomyces lydicus TaxID=47763 RepID=UPI001F508E80|nr:antibiotic biosynthesis monooxygenase [Streptomyces lydicus]MCZ1011102.1 antibiotic biosynthesis monooxygenase [Streptomyces lydicus]
MSARASRDSAADIATVVTSQKVREGRTDEYRRWQDRANQAAREFEGFVDAEVYPPGAGEENEWVAVFRFSGMDCLTAWLESGRRRELLDEASGLFQGPPAQEVLRGGSPARPATDVVTAVISHEVTPGREQQFLRWQEKTLTAQEKAPGFMGSELFKPVEGVQEHWVVVFRFDSREHLDDWLHSEVRTKLLAEGRKYFTSYDVRKVGSAFSGWFQFDRRGGAPPNWKQAMSVVLALYPTVMVLNLTVGVGLEKLTIREYIGLFLSNVLSVSALTWLLMPLVNRALAFWLVPSRATGRKEQVLGVGLVLLGYLVSIAVFGLITHQIW